ncbi:MAG: segregation and condensation protein A [Planctomycetota bacterium]
MQLDVYNGPLDLLLYLIRRDEVDIYDIPIAAITEQFVAYVELIKQLDPNLAGDFLVMAASLMEIKTRMLLPTPPPEEEGDEDAFIDPRSELVRQLLEYKRFKDAAGDLQDAAEMQAMRYPRQPVHFKPDDDGLDLEDVQIWDLMTAFNQVLIAIGQDAKFHEVIYDDTPIELHEVDIIDRLERDGAMSFATIFEGVTSRGQLVGMFIALLELVRQRRVLIGQDANFAEINVELNPNPPTPEELEEMLRQRHEETQAEEAEAKAHAEEAAAAKAAKAKARAEAAASAVADGGEAGASVSAVADSAEAGASASTCADEDDGDFDDDDFDDEDDDEDDD